MVDKQKLFPPFMHFLVVQKDNSSKLAKNMWAFPGPFRLENSFISVAVFQDEGGCKQPGV
jgi:hypothetical protein